MSRRSRRGDPIEEELVALPSESEGEEEEVFEDDEDNEVDAAEAEMDDDEEDEDGADDDDDEDGNPDPTSSATSALLSADDDEDEEEEEEFEPLAKRQATADDGPTFVPSPPEVIQAALADPAKFKRSYVLHDACESGNVAFLKEAFARDISGSHLPHYFDMKLDAKDMDGSTPLHVALLNANFECVELMLQNGAEVFLKAEGSSPLHIAVSMGSFTKHRGFAVAATRLLLQYKVDVNSIDDLGRTAVHLAAQFDLSECTELILAAPDFEKPFAQDKDGNTALHTAVQFGSTGVSSVLLAFAKMNNTGLVSITNKDGWTPLHTLCYYQAESPAAYPTLGASTAGAVGVLVQQLLEAGAKKDAEDRLGRTPQDWAKRNKSASPAAKALISWSSECLLHLTAPAIARRKDPPPPENVRRLRVLLDDDAGILKADEFTAAAEWLASDRMAAMVDILRCHEYSYVHNLKVMAQKVTQTQNNLLAAAQAINPAATNQGASTSFALSGRTAPKGIPASMHHIDGDTVISDGSYTAALAAAGIVCEAVDRVVSGANKTAFCLVRPPGHHAGPTGVVHADADKTGSSYGFCLLNNIAIGAAYARCVLRNQGIRRVAIVDFDVHHGNGTEAIVRNLTPSTAVSTFEDEFMTSLVIKRQCYKPWLDETDPDEVFFASVHGAKEAASWFYPGSGDTTSGVAEAVAVKATTSISLPSTLLPYSEPTAVRPGVPATASHANAQVLNVGFGPRRPVRLWRQAWRHAILPKILQHKPDIILISAGFDAHKRDDINGGHLGIDERDYYWLTKQLVKVANTVCHGRIVSALEGGYRIHGKVVSPFGRSVAAHMRALQEPCAEKWDAEAAEAERAAEDEEERLLLEAQTKAAQEAEQRRQEYLARAAAAEAEAMGEVVADTGRGRRRAPVDYVALSAEMDRQKAEKKRLREQEQQAK